MIRFMRYGVILGLVLWLGITKLAVADTGSVFVSILPQRYFVKKIGGEHVTVHVMVQPGANPAIYEPKPKQMAALSGCRLYFSIGVPFESVWLDKIANTNPRMTIIHTDSGIKKIPIQAKDHDHSHHRVHVKTDDRELPDPHIWLSPPLVKHQAKHIYEALVKIDPVHQTAYSANYHHFVQEIDLLDQDLRHRFAEHQDAVFMVFHPSWGYFAKTYGLIQLPIEVAGKAPKPAQLKELIQTASNRGIKVIFAQPQFSMKTAQTIARAIGASVVPADPLAPNWSENLRDHARQLHRALTSESDIQ